MFNLKLVLHFNLLLKKNYTRGKYWRKVRYTSVSGDPMMSKDTLSEWRWEKVCGFLHFSHLIQFTMHLQQRRLRCVSAFLNLSEVQLMHEISPFTFNDFARTLTEAEQNLQFLICVCLLNAARYFFCFIFFRILH